MSQDLMICTSCGQLVDRTHHKCPIQIKARMERDRKQYQNEKSTAKELTSNKWKKFRRTINCSCGQQFYFESMGVSINCIKCAKPHDISEYPEIVELVEEDQNGI